jgi:hypothetical protein
MWRSPSGLRDPLREPQSSYAGTLWRGERPAATTRVRLDDDAAWKLLFNALSEAAAALAVRIEGQPGLAAPFLRARSVVV